MESTPGWGIVSVSCPKCNWPIGPEAFNTGGLTACRQCHSKVGTTVFPAFFRRSQVARGESISTGQEASCFYHPTKKAAFHCDTCGRFLCALCEIKVGRRHLCPSCLARVGKEDKPSELDTSRVLYDWLALFLAVLPAVVTPLVTFYLAIAHWNAPGGLLKPASRTVWTIACVLAAAQLVAWCIVFARAGDWL